MGGGSLEAFQDKNLDLICVTENCIKPIVSLSMNEPDRHF